MDMNFVVDCVLVGCGVMIGTVVFAAVREVADLLRTAKSVGYDQPGVHRHLGYYGPNNRDLPDISTGWHIFADGNMWCAVGPTFENLQESPAGFGATPQQAFDELVLDLKRIGASGLADQIEPENVQIHQPTVMPNGR